MSLQNSTFKTTHVMDNEIIKANDFEFAFEQLVDNVSKATQMFLESTQDFVINGKVIPATGMNVSVSPIYGVCKSTGKPFGRTETTDETIGFEGSSSGRVDILEVQGAWETYDNQQRAFNDPDTDTQTYQYVDTKKLTKPVYQIKKGVEGAGVAPEVDAGWVKLAEVSIRAGASSILESDIHNITADVAGLNNDGWTTQPAATYNIGYISDVNARFRVQHNEDGTHKDDCINSDSLDIGTGAKQINGNILPVGGAVSIPTETIASTDSILSVITKAAAMLTSLYNGYLQYGVYGFKGELKVSNILDANDDLSKPISLYAAGDGTAVIKVNGNAVISVDANGKLSTNGYTASSNNHIVTKLVTDGLKSLIDALDVRVTNIENTSDVTVYSNGVLSSGTNGSSGTDSRYNVDSVVIYAATTVNITLSGSQTIDGTTPANGSFILVKNQTDAKENGIYQYSSSSTWTRHNDYLSPNALKNKLFNVVNGTNNGGRMFYLPKVNFTDGSDFGTDDILFAEYFGSIAPKANKVAMRDSSGHVKTAASTANDDAVNRGELVNANAMFMLIFNQIIRIGFTYTQYPGMESPMDMWGDFSTWEVIDYGGAFFRSEGGNASPFEASKTVSGMSGTSITINAHGLTVGSVLYDKVHNEARVITAITNANVVVVNAAFSYSNITNLLITQNSQNLSHSHTTDTQSTTSARTSTKIYNSSNTEISNTGEMSGNTSSKWVMSGNYGATYDNGRITHSVAYSQHGTSWGGHDIVTYTINLSHSHNMQHNHTVDISHTHGTTSNGGDEARPIDYTYKIWKRTA